MIMKRPLTFRRDDRGAAAVEFALIIPILVSLLLLGVQGWLQLNQASQMQSALQAGVRYYQAGGSDDSAAAQVALQSWNGQPANASVNAQRSCTCGGAGADCASQCTGGNLPSVYVTLSASGNYSEMIGHQVRTTSSQVRIR